MITCHSKVCRAAMHTHKKPKAWAGVGRARSSRIVTVSKLPPGRRPGAGPPKLLPRRPNSSPGAGPAPGQSRIIEFNFRFVYLVVKENINATLDGDNPSDVHWSFQQCLLGIFFVDGGLTPSLRPGPGAGCREASVD